MMETKDKALIGTLIVLSFTLPIFRSGGRTGLTFWGWIFNHSIFGPPVEYVPFEDYARELEEIKVIRLQPSKTELEKVSAFYQISEASAKELLSHAR